MSGKITRKSRKENGTRNFLIRSDLLVFWLQHLRMYMCTGRCAFLPWAPRTALILRHTTLLTCFLSTKFILNFLTCFFTLDHCVFSKQECHLFQHLWGFFYFSRSFPICTGKPVSSNVPLNQFYFREKFFFALTKIVQFACSFFSSIHFFLSIENIPRSNFLLPSAQQLYNIPKKSRAMMYTIHLHGALRPGCHWRRAPGRPGRWHLREGPPRSWKKTRTDFVQWPASHGSKLPKKLYMSYKKTILEPGIPPWSQII